MEINPEFLHVALIKVTVTRVNPVGTGPQPSSSSRARFLFLPEAHASARGHLQLPRTAVLPFSPQRGTRRICDRCVLFAVCSRSPVLARAQAAQAKSLLVFGSRMRVKCAHMASDDG